LAIWKWELRSRSAKGAIRSSGYRCLKVDMQAPSFVRRGASERLKALLIEKYGATTNDDATTERDH
jgi:hypothetical protein